MIAQAFLIAQHALQVFMCLFAVLNLDKVCYNMTSGNNDMRSIIPVSKTSKLFWFKEITMLCEKLKGLTYLH